MSLTKPKKTKLNQQQIKRAGSHHRKSNDYHKPYWLWCYGYILSVCVVRYKILGGASIHRNDNCLVTVFAVTSTIRNTKSNLCVSVI